MKNCIFLIICLVIVSCNNNHIEDFEPKLNISDQNYEVLERDMQGNTVDARFKNLPFLPGEILDTLPYLKTIRLIEIDSLTEKMGSLNNLEFIRIYSTKLERLPESIGNLTHLKSIEFLRSNITSLPVTLESSNSLTSIVIQFNPTELISSVLRINNLEELYLKGNQNESIPTSISQLVNLKILSVDWVSNLPKEIGDLNELELFELNMGNVDSIPSSIGKLKKLKKFVIFKNSKKIRIPNELSQCISLETLDLNTAISRLPKDIGNLKKLKMIWLTNTEDSLLEIPSSISQLTSLVEINIYNNNIKVFPHSISGLTSLELLNLSDNDLIGLPENFEFLDNLSVIAAGKNKIKTIPETIRNLHKLEHLHLSYNQIEEIPDVIEELTNLKILNLNYNEITSLPINSIAKLTKLRHLYLIGNDIPESHIFQLKMALPNTLIHY